MLAILIYAIIGLFAVYAAAFAHIITAINRSYDPFPFWELLRKELQMGPVETAIRFVWGLAIWPVRLYQFVTAIPELYKHYDPMVED